MANIGSRFVTSYEVNRHIVAGTQKLRSRNLTCGALSKRGKRSYTRRFRGVIEFLRLSRLSQSCSLHGCSSSGSFLFGGTIAENITFSRPSSTREEIMSSLY